jgi:hypothetical protein
MHVGCRLWRAIYCARSSILVIFIHRPYATDLLVFCVQAQTTR